MTKAEKLDLLMIIHGKIADLVWDKETPRTSEVYDTLNKVWEVISKTINEEL